MDILSEREGVVSPSNRPISLMSEPSSPTTKSRVHTMPNKRKIGTFFKGGKQQSKSFSKADSLARKRKGQRSGFLGSYHDDTTLADGYGESIDLVYSEQVDVEISAIQGEGVWAGCVCVWLCVWAWTGVRVCVNVCERLSVCVLV